MDKHITINNFEFQEHCHICMKIGSHTPLFLYTPDNAFVTEDTWLCMDCAEVEFDDGWD